MELTLVAVVGIIFVVATSAVSERIGVAAPLGLVVLGLALGFLPGLRAEVSPELILAGVLPPLLYASATRMPAHDFRRDFKAIVSLAVVLVVITTVVTGYLFSWVLPGIGLAAAFALGAIVSPTDAVAATSVGRRLGLPSRLLTILEGEGLVNDATALVLLSSAISAMGTDVSLWHVASGFVLSVVVAVPIGAFVGWFSVRVRSWFREAVFTTSISFVVPFVAYLPAQALHASGVLSVVVAGLVAGHQAPRHVPAATRVAESINWQTIAFLLEGGIFLVMGLQLRALWDDDLEANLSATTAVWVGLVATLVVIVLRMGFIAPIVAGLRQEAERARGKLSRLDQQQARVEDPEVQDRVSERRLQQFQLRVTQKRADVEFAVAERFGFRGGLVLAWSGMRGAVTVAAAQTLPADTPHRPQLILVAFTVATATLLLQGLTLPTVIRRLRVAGDDVAADRNAYVDLLSDLNDAATAMLDDPHLESSDGRAYDEGILNQVREALRMRVKNTEAATDRDEEERARYLELMAEVISAQRSALLQARTEGSYNSRVLGRAQRALDLRETLFQQMPSTSA